MHVRMCERVGVRVYGCCVCTVCAVCAACAACAACVYVCECVSAYEFMCVRACSRVRVFLGVRYVCTRARLHALAAAPRDSTS